MSLLLRLFKCLLVLSVVTVSATSISDRNYKACGENLRSRVDVICEGQHNRRTDKKRADPMISSFDAYSQANDIDSDALLNYDEATGLSQYQQFQRIRRIGISDECCRQSCSDSTIRFYYCSKRL